MLPYIHAPFVYASDKLGASPDEIKLLFTFLLSYPLAGALKRIPDNKPWAKNAFNISVALFYLVGLFDLWSGVRTLLVDAAVTFAIAAYVEGPFMPWLAFVFLMGHMSVNHIRRQIVADPGLIDITGAQMVNIMKLSAFAWNVHDGKYPSSELSEYQKERALRKLPSILDYLSFVFFFPSLMVGPAFDFVDYRRWIETSMFDLPEGFDKSKAPPTRGKRRIPRSGTPAMWKAAQGSAWILIYLQLSSLYVPGFFLSSKYMTYGFVRRVWFLHMLGVTTRTKYYGVWSMTEGACILSGIGYKGVDPKTGNADWGRLTNIRPLGIELAQNSYAYLGNWNINTNYWLRNYVYLRVTPKGKKPGFRASMATFVTSAFWHGFEPGYYMTFVLASFLQTIAKNGRRLLRPFFMTPDGSRPTANKRYYDVFSWFITQTAFSFTTAPFILLSLEDSFKVWARVYFYCVVGAAACLGFLASPGKSWLQREIKKRSTGPKIVRVQSHDGQPVLGLPNDPEKEVGEAIEELKQELDKRKQAGQPVTNDVKKAIEDKMRVSEDAKKVIENKLGIKRQ
ncbi:MAG: lysophospholipid acyltransferase [Bathelium mastoideum]|nr:MAG: lysophospholipid acyltransferase [Bathelium mastoideum]